MVKTEQRREQTVGILWVLPQSPKFPEQCQVLSWFLKRTDQGSRAEMLTVTMRPRWKVGGAGQLQNGGGSGCRAGNLAQISLQSDSFQGNQVRRHVRARAACLSC